MTINEHLTEFEGLPVVDYQGVENHGDMSRLAIRVSVGWNEEVSFIERFAELLAHPNAAQIPALLIGDWGDASTGNDSSVVVEALVSARDCLPSLRALFLGELIVDESEISWINQSDVSALFEAFPLLEVFYVRGGNGLALGRPRHDRLRKLVVETGGMADSTVHEVTSAELPSLEHLELWLGDDGYGNSVDVEDIRQLLTKGPCGKLKYLGLRDDCNADHTATCLAETGIAPSVEVLDLSLGALSDAGATALAGCGWLKQLKKLDIHFHYVSPEVVAKLRAIVSEVNADDVQEADDWDGEPHRYVAVGE